MDTPLSVARQIEYIANRSMHGNICNVFYDVSLAAHNLTFDIDDSIYLPGCFRDQVEVDRLQAEGLIPMPGNGGK